MHSIHVKIKQSYLEYNKKMCFQNYGFVVGNPSGVILRELYIQKYESLNALNRNIYKRYIKAYLRYVDIFILFNGINRHAEVMVKGLNENNKITNLLSRHKLIMKLTS